MKLRVNAGSGGYDIVIEHGVLYRIGEELNLNRKVLIVTDDGVPRQYAGALKRFCKNAFTVTVKQGENSKSIEVWQSLLKTMAQNGFTRSDCVVAVGGGMVGDLAGFTAASYMRGIDFYNIPTTLLSQVDSSIGGKTAVNFEGVKNLVGAFYQPKKVIIDPETLKSLNERLFAEGIAEAVKMAVCFDKELFELIENKDINENLDKIILGSLKIKRAVVEQDEKEKGLRRALNFGHTLAHGIEVKGEMYHGECVALGMLPMCSPEIRTRLESIYVKTGLPTECKADIDKVIDAVTHDKKLDGDTLNTVFVNEAGSFEFKKSTVPQFEKTVKDSGVIIN